MKLLRELVQSEYLKRIDSFFLCIQTHGDLLNGHTIMEFSDGNREFTDVIVTLFSNTNCPALVEKPKVFFFPFCRGKISDKLKNVYIPSTETDGILQRQFLVPSISDILICYGTVPGFRTHRDTEFGSWYVRELCKVFAENACLHHIEELLKLVGMNTMDYKKAEGLVQVASSESRGFNSLLYLNPKIWDP
jgi:caspase-like apoptosis-related cysteine protease